MEIFYKQMKRFEEYMPEIHYLSYSDNELLDFSRSVTIAQNTQVSRLHEKHIKIGKSNNSIYKPNFRFN